MQVSRLETQSILESTKPLEGKVKTLRHKNAQLAAACEVCCVMRVGLCHPATGACSCDAEQNPEPVPKMLQYLGTFETREEARVAGAKFRNTVTQRDTSRLPEGAASNGPICVNKGWMDQLIYEWTSMAISEPLGVIPYERGAQPALEGMLNCLVQRVAGLVLSLSALFCAHRLVSVALTQTGLMFLS